MVQEQGEGESAPRRWGEARPGGASGPPGTDGGDFGGAARRGRVVRREILIAGWRH